MKPHSIAFLVYGDSRSNRNALTEEKYRDLATAFIATECMVNSILYCDANKEEVYNVLKAFDAVLVWVNPIEQGSSRRELDSLLVKLAGEGVFVSAHPETILKIGTKDVLFKTQNIGWVGKTRIYSSYDEFVAKFPAALEEYGSKILKQHRGNGGAGVFKIVKETRQGHLTVIHANNSLEERHLSWADFNREFQSYFVKDGLLIEQDWNKNLPNGMVRCYLTGNKVAGFGYQEINALYERNDGNSKIHLPPSKRYYFTENCGLFSDLKLAMEDSWIPQLQKNQAVSDEMMPVIWDADFFINQINTNNVSQKYSLCEINVSCVSPFPPSAIPFIVKETIRRIERIKGKYISVY